MGCAKLQKWFLTEYQFVFDHAGESNYNYNVDHSAPVVDGYNDMAYEEFDDGEELQIQYTETPVKHKR